MGCSVTDDVTVTIVPPLVINEAILDMNCCIGGSIELMISGGSGSGPYLTTWSDPALSGLSVSDLAAGSYTVTVTDSNSNCTQIETYIVGNACNCSDLVVEDTIFMSASNPMDLCLPFTFQESQNVYEVILDLSLIHI